MTQPVRFSNSAGGGKELTVGASGVIRVLATAGGKIVGAAGGRAIHIANRASTSATSGAVVATAYNAHQASMASGLNAVLTVLRNIGALATA